MDDVEALKAKLRSLLERVTEDLDTFSSKLVDHLEEAAEVAEKLEARVLGQRPKGVAPWDGGYAAFKAGAPKDSCPHEGGRERVEWVDGWECAQADARTGEGGEEG